jgi:hypothetical protein
MIKYALALGFVLANIPTQSFANLVYTQPGEPANHTSIQTQPPVDGDRDGDRNRDGDGWGKPIVERTYDPRVKDVKDKYRCFTKASHAIPDKEGHNAWCVNNH